MPHRNALADTAQSRTVWIARAFWIDCAVAVIAILPFLLTAHLPLTDLPNHLARQYIIRDWSSDTNFQTFYAYRWSLVPNLALDLFVLAARQIMSPDLAVRLFAAVTIIMLLSGTRFVSL